MTAVAAVPWLLAAFAAAVLGARSGHTTNDRPATRRARPSRRRPRTAGRSGPSAFLRSPLVAVVAVGAVAVTLGGWRWGGGAAVVVAPVLVRWLRSAAVRATSEPESDEQLPLALDLLAAAVRSGRSTAEALEVVAGVAPSHRDLLLRVGAHLRLGAAPAEAWASVPRDGPLASVARLVARSGISGARFAAVLEQEAAAMRTGDHARRLAAAHRAGVTLLAPLGACFLPAFVLLGVVPVIAGVLASTQLVPP
ncbi:MAG: type II secretion system F family protein [Jatrophihabitans sp.]|uniref:type II secretion system F family protein n=1 Tax=Jatrophihabitans sp. TaxID=1932789 RepID=UPI003F7DDABB